MMRVNLLPWREQRRKEKEGQLLRHGALGWVALGLVMLYWHLHLVGLIHLQQRRNTYLHQQIARMDKKIAKIAKIRKTRNALLARMKIIQELQADRMQIVHTFNALVRDVPKGVYLKTLTQKGGKFTLSGVAESNERVAKLMRNFDASNWFANPTLQIINVKKAAGGHRSLFKLTVQRANKLANKKKKAHKGRVVR